MVALIDADDKHHQAIRILFEDNPEVWVLPWAILPEVDYLLMNHVGVKAEKAFLSDLAGGLYTVEWGDQADLRRGEELSTRHSSLNIGLVDGVVIAVAERLKADAIATLDLRHFAVVAIQGNPRLLPRDG